MKTVQEKYSKELFPQKRHPVRQKLLSVLLCVCLLLVSLPMEGYGSEVQAEELQKKVLSFSELSEEVKYQTVEYGTPLEELKLPETLEAICVPVGQESNANPGTMVWTEESPDVKGTDPEEGNPLEETQDFSGDDNNGEELPVENEPEESTSPSESGAEAQPDTEEILEPNPETNTNLEEVVVIEHITWTGTPAYGSQTEGVYIFTPVLPERYVPAEGVGLPEIQVTVKSEENSEGNREGQETFSEGKREKYGTEEEITKEYVGGAEDREYRAQSVSETRVISRSETWNDPETLSDVELVINEGATLTINNTVTVDGTVTIQGGGTIARGSANARMIADENTVLTMQNIIIDGKELTSSQAMICINKGQLTVEGCRIQNCNNENLRDDQTGGAVHLTGGTVNFSESEIKNCSAKNGGVIFSQEGNITLKENCRIEFCNASVSGGAVYLRGGTAEFSDSEIKNCSAQSSAGAIYSYGGNITLKENCRIQDCNSIQFLGGAVYLHEGTAEFSDSEIKNCSTESSGGAICSYEGNVTLNKNFSIQLCSAKQAGGGVYLCGGTAEFNGCTIAECSAGQAGGAVANIQENTLTINDGTYKNNRTTSHRGENFTDGGGFLLNSATVYIYGGDFINNTSEGRGGAIHHSGMRGTETYLYGGTFQGNSCSQEKYKGSGGAWLDSVFTLETHFEMADGVKFCGDGTDFGMDGIYLDSQKSTPRKIMVSNALSHPATVYLKAVDHYVIVEGTGDYQLTMADVRKFSVVDVNGEEWYKGLDTAANQIYLTKEDPGYGFRIFYYNVDGKVTDNTEYSFGASATIQSVEDLENPIPNQERFLGWCENEDGTGTVYKGGESVVMEKDLHLYPVYGKKNLSADFYSGGPDPSPPHHEEREGEEDVESETIVAPSLENFPGWTPLGWNESPVAYEGAIAEGENCILTEATKKYYGIYQKEVILSYDSADSGIDVTVPQQKAACYANVHETITYQKADFTLEEGPEISGYTFKGWSRRESGGGTLHEAGAELSIQEDTTLYAVYEEKGKKTFTADFYSGNPLQIKSEKAEEDEGATEGTVTAPFLEAMTGWTSLGWNQSSTAYIAGIQPGQTLTLTKPLTEYYGIYEKDITLSYDSNGGGSVPEPEKKACYANVHKEITQKYPDFIIPGAIRREGYTFVEWNTASDGTGISYEPGITRKLEQDTLLYAVWKETSTAPEPSGPSEPEPSGPDTPAPETALYRVEYYCQNLTGKEYTRMESDTRFLTGTTGTEVEASQKNYTGFTVNLSHPWGKSKGTVEADGSLILKLYYDRILYEVNFDLNGGYGKIPDTQQIRYGGLLEQVSDPFRRGYNFKGWYMEESGLEGGIWDFESPVENNTGRLETTLYAKWVDELAPEMGKASFSRGSRNFLDWLIQKESMVITVPVTEEGSGLARAEYHLVAEDGTEQDGQAQISETHTLSDTMAAYGSSAAIIRGIQGEAEQGNYEARIAIEEEFKGKVYLTCTDYAGNVSPQKTLTTEGGGVIVEDNAPEIRFDGTKETTGGKPLEVKVEVRDEMKNRMTSGLSGVRYQVDKEKTVSFPEENFTGDFVDTYEFTVKIKGEGNHILRVEAEDRAGNKSAAEVTLKISGSRDIPVEMPEDISPGNPGRPGRPMGGEPKTGESTQIQICATLAMIAGFGYLLLYFEGENGITEKEKEEIIYRMVTWAKQGGRIRRLLGLAGIFLFLTYYHSIGKSVDVEWKEVYGKN